MEFFLVLGKFPLTSHCVYNWDSDGYLHLAEVLTQLLHIKKNIVSLDHQPVLKNIGWFPSTIFSFQFSSALYPLNCLFLHGRVYDLLQGLQQKDKERSPSNRGKRSLPCSAKRSGLLRRAMPQLHQLGWENLFVWALNGILSKLPTAAIRITFTKSHCPAFLWEGGDVTQSMGFSRLHCLS